LITRALPLVAVRPRGPEPYRRLPANPVGAARQQDTAAQVEPG
jgi:hypothetical protein